MADDNKTDEPTPAAIMATDAPPRVRPSNMPDPFATRMAKRHKQALGDVFGLRNFGVNLSRIAPGGESSLFHRHGKQDEFIYILEGEPVLVTDAGEMPLKPGMCAGFPAGGTAHHMLNRTDRDVIYLEVGDRTRGDLAVYPNDDIEALPAEGGGRTYQHKDGRPY